MTAASPLPLETDCGLLRNSCEGGPRSADDGARRRSRTLFRGAWALVLVGLLLLPADPFLAASASGSALTPEYDLKAVFLFHFAEFVNWPADAFPNAETPITIGVLGKDPFGASLDEILANETVGGRKLIVRRYPTVQELDGCHILFVCRSEATRWDRVRARLAGRSVLTVGETKEFTEHRGIIALVTSHERLRMRINLAAANEAKLTISSKLLRQAELVDVPAEGR